MPEQIVEIIGRGGRRRRARKGEMLADGERFSLPMSFMDAQAREVADVLAAKYGHHSTGDDATMRNNARPRGWVRGFTALDALRVEHTLEDAATQAYAERSARMANAWRNKGTAHQAESRDAARIAANDAYEQMRARLHYGNRHRQQDAGATERAPTRTLDEACAAADAAYKAKCERLANLWKHRDAKED